MKSFQAVTAKGHGIVRYAELVRQMHDAGLRPERFTLGTLSFLSTVQRQANDPASAIFEMVEANDDPDGRKRVPDALR